MPASSRLPKRFASSRATWSTDDQKLPGPTKPRRSKPISLTGSGTCHSEPPAPSPSPSDIHIKMRSLKQIQASRANGVRSRGPITAQGKRNSSRNSTRHGFSAPDRSLNENPPAAFLDLRAGFMASHRPRKVAEAQLVRTPAVAHWRSHQVIPAQTNSLNKAMASHLPDSPDPAVRAVLAFETGSEFHALNRYEAAFDRQCPRILRRLLSLQSRPEKIVLAERTQQAIESKPAAIKAALPNPAPSATSTIYEDSGQASSIPLLHGRARKARRRQQTAMFDLAQRPRRASHRNGFRTTLVRRRQPSSPRRPGQASTF
jgi:hypothetical protein